MEARTSPAPERRAEAYERLRRPVLRSARRWFPSLSTDDLEDLYQAAWLSAIRTQSPIESLDAYLYRAIRSEGLMELRRRRRRPTQSLDPVVGDGDHVSVTSRGAPLADRTAAQPDETAETLALSGLIEDVLSELSERQRTVVKLRWGWGLSRPEIAAALGVSERSVKRELQRAGALLAEQSEVVAAGRWCQRRRSLVTAYALGLLSSSRSARAETHVRACPACKGLVMELRRHSEQLGAVAPVPPVAGAAPGDPVGAGADLLDGARGQLIDLVQGAKQQAVSLAARAMDPTPLAGARPGALATVVAGCVAVGGGTYCAVSGDVPVPVARVFGERQVQGEARPDRPEPNPSPATPPPSDPPVAPVTPPKEASPSPAQAPPPEPARQPPPPVESEFYGTSAAQTPPVEATRSGGGSTRMAPAPEGGPGEFGAP